jgi:hypothetical protein
MELSEQPQAPPQTADEWTPEQIAIARAAIFKEVEQGTRADRARREQQRHSYRAARTRGE